MVAGLFALGEPFGEQLGAAARSYVLGHFSSCAATEPFARWPQKVSLSSSMGTRWHQHRSWAVELLVNDAEPQQLGDGVGWLGMANDGS